MAKSDPCGRKSKRHDHDSLNKHHIYPRARMKRGNPHKSEQRGKGGNVVEVCKGCHEVMNELFGGDATPLEILDFLIHRMWGGQEFWLYLYLNDGG